VAIRIAFVLRHRCTSLSFFLRFQKKLNVAYEQIRIHKQLLISVINYDYQSELVDINVLAEGKISNKYVREHLKLAQGFFGSYLMRGVDMLKSSHTIGLRWEYDDVRFASLSDSQVRRVIIASKRKPEWFQWFVLVSIYSGARRSEIAQLNANDFMLDDESGCHYFLFRQGKTKAARRRVPVHNELIEAGLLDWVSSIITDRYTHDFLLGAVLYVVDNVSF